MIGLYRLTLECNLHISDDHQHTIDVSICLSHHIYICRQLFWWAVVLNGRSKGSCQCVMSKSNTTSCSPGPSDSLTLSSALILPQHNWATLGGYLSQNPHRLHQSPSMKMPLNSPLLPDTTQKLQQWEIRLAERFLCQGSWQTTMGVPVVDGPGQNSS